MPRELITPPSNLEPEWETTSYSYHFSSGQHEHEADEQVRVRIREVDGEPLDGSNEQPSKTPTSIPSKGFLTEKDCHLPLPLLLTPLKKSTYLIGFLSMDDPNSNYIEERVVERYPEHSPREPLSDKPKQANYLDIYLAEYPLYIGRCRLCTNCGVILERLPPITTRSGRQGSNQQQTLCGICSANYFICNTCGQAKVRPSSRRSVFTCGACTRRLLNIEQYQGMDILSDSRTRLRSYHHAPALVFHDDLGDIIPASPHEIYYGIELETDDYFSLEYATFFLKQISHQERLFFCETDSSIPEGLEIITQPGTLPWLENKLPWDNIIDIVKEFGGKSHSTGTCGLHVHFSRSPLFTTADGARRASQEDRVIYNLMYMIEKFWKPLVAFSRRDLRSMNFTKKFDRAISTMTPKTIADYKNMVERHVALNMKNPLTLEIRIFRGSLVKQTILASLELTDHLVALAMKLPTAKCKKLTWNEMVKASNPERHANMLRYISERNIDEEGNYKYVSHNRKA